MPWGGGPGAGPCGSQAPQAPATSLLKGELGSVCGRVPERVLCHLWPILSRPLAGGGPASARSPSGSVPPTDRRAPGHRRPGEGQDRTPDLAWGRRGIRPRPRAQSRSQAVAVRAGDVCEGDVCRCQLGGPGLHRGPGSPPHCSVNACLMTQHRSRSCVSHGARWPGDAWKAFTGRLLVAAFLGRDSSVP